MLERLADYDDALMEELLSDIEPPRDQVFDDLARELREGHVVPLLIGSATGGHGVTRLLKALRHEAPGVRQTRQRLGVRDSGPPLAQVVRTIHTAHGGKLSLARVLRGSFARRRASGRLERRRGADRRPRAADGRDLAEDSARRAKATRSLSSGSNASRPATDSPKARPRRPLPAGSSRRRRRRRSPSTSRIARTRCASPPRSPS